MPKIRTRKAAAKRIKVTGTGKVMLRRAHKSHLLTHKTAKRKRRLGADIVASKADSKAAKRMAPYAR
jgi:large subunit ribosomal protein L35